MVSFNIIVGLEAYRISRTGLASAVCAQNLHSVRVTEEDYRDDYSVSVSDFLVQITRSNPSPFFPISCEVSVTGVLGVWSGVEVPPPTMEFLILELCRQFTSVHIEHAAKTLILGNRTALGVASQHHLSRRACGVVLCNLLLSIRDAYRHRGIQVEVGWIDYGAGVRSRDLVQYGIYDSVL